ncbi:IMP cyclohydrolase [Streptacidiphilus sp. PAMC 29251]
MITGLGGALEENTYPGRGVLWCRTGDGVLRGGYFLTGRSPASQARELRRGPGGELVVAPTGHGEHDSLRHYTAVREAAGRLVFGNGEQVDTVAGRLTQGQPPQQALDGLDYEPDPPIFTPRLTVVVDGAQAWFGAARRSPSGRTATDRMTLRVGELGPGEGVLATTYRSDGSAVATGAPWVEFRTSAGADEDLLEQLWAAVTPRFRVAAAVFTQGRLPGAAVRQAGAVLRQAGAAR